MQFCIVREDHRTECNRFNGCPSAGLIKFSAVGRSMISILYGAGGGGAGIDGGIASDGIASDGASSHAVIARLAGEPTWPSLPNLFRPQWREPRERPREGTRQKTRGPGEGGQGGGEERQERHRGVQEGHRGAQEGQGGGQEGEKEAEGAGRGERR